MKKPRTRSALTLLPVMVLLGAMGSAYLGAAEDSTAEGQPEEASAKISSFEEHVVVTASRTQTRILDTPQAVTVITEEELERRRGETYADIFSSVPGVTGARYGTRDFNFNIRGATQNGAPYVLVLVDGQPVYDDTFGLVLWDTVPVGVNEIDQIEVVRGPASSVWGANAMNGVINFIRKSPRELAGTRSIRIGAGENGIREAGLLYAEGHDNWSWKISGNYAEEDPGDRDDGMLSGGRVLPPFDYESARQRKVDFQADRENLWGGTLTLGLGGGEIDGNTFGVDGPYQIQDDARKVYGRVVYKRNRTRVQLYINDSESSNVNLFSGFPLITDARAWDLQFVSDKFFSKGRVVYGANFKLNKFDINTVPNEDQRSEGGAFLEYQTVVRKGHLLTLGSRFDWNEEYGTELSPKLGYIAKIRDGHALRLSASRSFRAPTPALNYWFAPFQLSFDFGAPIGVITWDAATVGNPDLEVEQMTAFEIGWTGTWAERLMLTASVFHNNQEDYYGSGPTAFHDDANPPPGWPMGVPVPPGVFLTEFSFFNVGRTEQVGAELSLNANLTDRWSLQTHWTWMDRPEVSGQGADSLLLNLPPRNRAGATLAYHVARWFASLELYHQSRAYWADVLGAMFADWTDSFESWSGSVGYRFPGDHLDLRVRGSNLLDEAYKHHVWGDVISRRISTELTIRF